MTKPNLPERYEDLKVEKGFVITSSKNRFNQNEVIETACGWGSFSFSSKKQALSALAMAKLSHLVKAYNEGWETPITSNGWDDNYFIIKFLPYLNNSVSLYINTYRSASDNSLLTFKDIKVAKQFSEKFEDLIKQFYIAE